MMLKKQIIPCSKAFHSGLVSIFVLLVLSLLSLFSVSLFRTGLNGLYVMRNEVALVESFYRAQDAAGLMTEWLHSIDDHLLTAATIQPSNDFPWLKTEKEIDFKQIGSPIYWKQLTPYNFPPNAQAIVIYLNTLPVTIPSESVVMTHDSCIKSYRFSIVAKAEVAGGVAIVETGIIRRIIQ
ncbi:MAG: hypothetical protein HQK75_15590 [Candidatus Magnetomorum sp.]|nr:hypothetical protein [Candidatus Magnetomorum sp.]